MHLVLRALHSDTPRLGGWIGKTENDVARCDLKWTTNSDPVSEERILEVQANLGVRFPKTFLECVRKWNGGRAGPHSFSCFDVEGNQQDEAGFAALLDFREPMDKYLKQIYRNDPDLWRDMDISPWWNIEDDNLFERPDHFTRGLIAFGEDGSGNYVCFDYRNGNDNPDPPVVFWHHEFHSDGEEPFFVARNFDAFLEMLRPSRDELPKSIA